MDVRDVGAARPWIPPCPGRGGDSPRGGGLPGARSGALARSSPRSPQRTLGDARVPNELADALQYRLDVGARRDASHPPRLPVGWTGEGGLTPGELSLPEFVPPGPTA